jgi:DNA-binding MarR family transcriptional regulator
MDRIFARLRAIRSFRARHLSFLETVVDYDLLLEIGFSQERGHALTMKQLHLLGICSVPTLQRRLRRLRQAGAIVQKKMAHDARAVQLTLSPRVLKVYQRYAEWIHGAVCAPAPSDADD